MKKFTGTVQTTTAIPMVEAPVTAPAVPQVETQSLINLLPSIKKEDGTPLVDYNQAISLAGLKFKNGESVLTLTDRYFVYEVTNLLNELDFEVVYNFLSVDWEKVFGSGPNLRKKILFDNPLLEPAREKLALDMEIYRNRVDVSVGAIDCRRCGSEETLSLEKQLRGGDESMTIKCTCLQCGYKWTAQ